MTCKLLMSCSLVLAVFLSGCGSSEETAKLKGKVTLDGKPVTVGDISFTTADGAKSTSAEIQSDGSYEVLDGVVVGTHTVAYSPPFAESPDDEGWEQAKDFLNCGVPDDFQIKVESGENTINIELVKKPRED